MVKNIWSPTCNLLLGAKVPHFSKKVNKCYAVHNIRAGTILKQKGPSCKKKELQMNLNSNTFQRKYEHFDENFNCVDLWKPKPKLQTHSDLKYLKTFWRLTEEDWLIEDWLCMNT